MITVKTLLEHLESQPTDAAVELTRTNGDPNTIVLSEVMDKLVKQKSESEDTYKLYQTTSDDRLRSVM